MIKKQYRKWLNILLGALNVFYIPYLCRLYRRELRALPDDVQPFFLTRMDFGTFIYLADYLKLWEEQRGKTALVVFTSKVAIVEAMFKAISPHTQLILPPALISRMAAIFGGQRVNDKTLYPLYGQMLVEFPRELHIWDPAPKASYSPYFDWRLKQIPEGVTPAFVATYGEIRTVSNHRNEVLLDAFSLYYKSSAERRTLLSDHVSRLKKVLGIRERFVTINLNSKKYKEKAANRKGVVDPQRYNCVIDTLIEKGFSVVFQGREEQPIFAPRAGLVDYARSGLASVENDIALVSGSYFAIFNKTGPESFTTVCNTPVLGLNYLELLALIPNRKLRFYPKRITHQGRVVTWKELLASPGFFDNAHRMYAPQWQFHDLEEEELLAALDEFLPLVEKDRDWDIYTPEQQEFKKHVHPLHLDLYDIPGVPCTTYLKRYQ